MRRALRLKQKNSQTTTARLQRQKGALLGLKNRVFFIGKIVLASAILIGALSLWQSDVFDYVGSLVEGTRAKTSSVFGLVVDDVLVEGRQNTSTKDILKVVNAHRGLSIYNIDPQEVKVGLEKLPWVRSATVQRRLNGIIYIRLVEKQPVALWQEASKLYLIDEKGSVIDRIDPKSVKDLIIVIGQQAPSKARELLIQLNQVPEIKGKIKAATYVSGRRWDLILKNKVKIQLPENNINAALANLYKLDKQHLITDGRVLSIDLRLPDRSFLYLSPQEHMKRKNGGRDEEV